MGRLGRNASMTPELLPPDAFKGPRLRRDGTWVVAFLADWCPFSRYFRSSFDAMDGGTIFRTGIADLTDDESPLWDEFDIEVVPALIVFSAGRPVYVQQSVPGVGLPADALEAARTAATAGR